MKLFLLACGSIGIFLLYQTFVGRTSANYSYCLTSAETARAEMTDRSCKVKKDIYTELSSCIIAAQKQGAVASFLYGPLGIESKVKLLMTAHNEDCPAEKVSAPGESLYL